MSAVDVMGSVSDRLVGGLMFHSEHADLCRWLGIEWLANVHEDGFLHDSSCLRRMRRLALRHTGCMAPEGRQDRSHALDAFRGTQRWCVKGDVREAALCDAMHDWCDWEEGTVTVLTSAVNRLESCGELLLADKVRAVAKDTSRELAEARDMLVEMESVNWEMPHILEMRRNK